MYFFPASIHFFKPYVWNVIPFAGSTKPSSIQFFIRNSYGSMPMAVAISSVRHSANQAAWGIPYPRIAPAVGEEV